MISMNWVKDYVDTNDMNLKVLADKITKTGINIEKVESRNIDNLVIGHVLEVTAHPDSDHLNVCKVDVGSEITQIVCGASNVRKDLKVIVALPGAILPGNFEIKKSKIRGVESNGMICALFELGLEEKTEETYNKGIHELDSNAPVGENPIKYLGLDDTIYTLDLNPNRFDCNNHIPFAYEVAAVLNTKVTLPSIDTKPVKDNIKDHFEIKVDTENCTMYNAKMVTNVKVGPSPDFIKQRLENAGMRSINNVVDISNYVMLEYGQPLHFFDKDTLGDKILVRMAHDNEKVITLDNKERVLNNDDIVITDGDKIVCIAGVMGGLNTEVEENTKNILIESAIFNPYNVRYTSIKLDLRSEASLRYEKGLNYEYCNLAIERACHLLEKYAGGTALEGTLTHDTTTKKEKVVEVTLDEINLMLGMKLNSNDVTSSLDSLGFTYKIDKDKFIVTIPNRRVDVEENKADIIEEVGRIYGYDNIKATLPVVRTKKGEYAPKTKFRKDISKRLRTLGFNEIRTYTLISEEGNNMFRYNFNDEIKLLRPMNIDKSIVRQSLLSSMLKMIEYNISRKNNDVMLYEIANTYDNSYEEDTKISFGLTGNYISNSWNKNNIQIDYYLVKGLVENILDYLGLTNRYTFKLSDNLPKEIHPKVNSEIIIDNEAVGYFGKIHPSTSKNNIYVCEISLNKLYSKKVRAIKFKELNKYPTISKDLAFIVDENITSEDITKVIKKSGGRLLTNINVFDLYKGDNISKDKKSLAFNLTFEDYNKTLAEEEVNVVFNKIINEVENKLKAELRDK